jgi:hypothetical protein
MWHDIKRIDSTDRNVSKFVFTNDTAVAESVLYKYPTYADRTVICCSTQSGCPVGCRFCGAGDKFVRSLTADEIFDQPRYLLKQTGVDPASIDKLQIMFMSMGEPLLNWKQLKSALYRLHETYPLAKLLISTSAPGNRHESFEELNRVSKEIPTNGESPADVYDRLGSFVENLHRDFQNPDFPGDLVIVTHGMTMRVLLMKLFNKTVDEFEAWVNPTNCTVWKLEYDDLTGLNFDFSTIKKREIKHHNRLKLIDL